MKRLFLCAAVALCASAMWVAPAAAEVEFHEPTGFGKATFGMSLDEVTRLYPTLHPAKIMAAAAGKGPRMLMLYDLDDQAAGPLEHCQLELRFLNDELYEIEFRCPERLKVGQYLQTTFGMPTAVTTGNAKWLGQHSSISLDAASGVFAYSDLERSKAMQELLNQARAQAGGTPPAAGAPDAPPPKQ